MGHHRVKQGVCWNVGPIGEGGRKFIHTLNKNSTFTSISVHIRLMKHEGITESVIRIMHQCVGVQSGPQKDG